MFQWGMPSKFDATRTGRWDTVTLWREPDHFAFSRLQIMVLEGSSLILR